MYSVDSSTIEEVKKLRRSFDIKITYNNFSFTMEDVESFNIEYNLTSDDMPSIGSCTTSKLTLSLINRDSMPTTYTNDAFKVYYCKYDLATAQRGTWYPLGVFYADNDTVKKTDVGVQIEAYDILNRLSVNPYEDPSGVSDLRSVRELANTLATTYNFTLKDVTQIASGLHIPKQPKTGLRGLLQKMAIINGSNVCVDFDGKVNFRRTGKTTVYTIDAENYDDFALKSESQFTIAQIVNKDRGSYESTVNGQTQQVNYADLYYPENISSGATLSVSYKDVLMQSSDLKTTFDLAYPITYYAYEMHCAAIPYLEVGDLVKFTDKKGVTRNILIMKHTLEFNGGLNSTFSCEPVSSTTQEITTSPTSGGTIGQVLRRLQVDIFNADKVVANLVEANLVQANEIEALTVTTTNLDANKASVDDLSAVQASIGTLQSGLTKTNNLIFANAEGTSIKTTFANALVAQIGSAQITNAMIESIAASKIASGTIYTNNVSVQSENGRMIMKDNTMQISDGTNVRVQIGKTSSNDYSLSVYNTAGDCIWDAQGVTTDGMRDGLITDDMVNEAANINGGKLNIPSIVSEINNGTATIKSSNILYDATNQTLNAAFSAVSQTATTASNKATAAETKANSLESSVTTLQSDFAVSNGKLTSVITESSSNKTRLDNLNVGVDNLIPGTSSDYKNYAVTNGTEYTICNKKAISQLSLSGGDDIVIRVYLKPVTVDVKLNLCYDYATSDDSFYYISTNVGSNTIAKDTEGYAIISCKLNNRLLDHNINLSIVPLADTVGGRNSATGQYKKLQMQKGTIPSGWIASRGDVVAGIEGEIADTNDSITALQQSTNTSITTLEQNINSFKTTVSETYATNNDAESLQQMITSSIEQTSDDIQFSFDQSTQYTDNKVGGVSSQLDNINTYMNFSADGLVIGKEGSAFKTKFDNTEVGFYDGDTKAAYINNESLYVPERIEVQGILTVGNPIDNYYFDWRVRDNGHLSLMWRGGND